MANKNEINRQLALVEVRGVEPRSAEFFVSNSPSAAAGWCRPERSRQPSLTGPSGIGLARQSRNPAGGIPHQRRPGPTGREPIGQDGLPIDQAASAICGLALIVFFQLFNEEPETSARFRHGDYSTSNPSHPHVFKVHYTNPR